MRDFFIKCNPPTATHHHKKIVKRGGFHSLADKPELVEAKESLAALFAPHVPDAPYMGPLRLDLSFRFPFLKSHAKSFRSTGTAMKTTKPDCSNLAKVVEDVMTRLAFWGDDSQIVTLVVSKGYADNPGIAVRIEGL